MIDKRTIRFVRALLGANAKALQTNKAIYMLDIKGVRLSLGTDQVSRLVSDGVLVVQKQFCFASPQARSWVKRQLSQSDEFGEQHRMMQVDTKGLLKNLNEGPLTRLAMPQKNKEAYLAHYHLLAAERIQVLTMQTQMMQRITMSYDPTHTGGNKKSVYPGNDIGNQAFIARKKLHNCLICMPADCAGVVLDVCGLQKGLQLVEVERQWPRRSAKLLLRVGLEQAAEHFGLASSIKGAKSQTVQSWIEPDARAELW